MNLFHQANARNAVRFVLLVLSWTCLAMPGKALADYPSKPIMVRLGPGNEDFEKRFEDCDDLTRLGDAVAAARGFNLSRRDLRMGVIHLHAHELHNVSFEGADLTGADLTETFFNGCSFRNAILRHVYLAGTSYLRDSCDLTNADIRGSWIRMTKEQLASTRNFVRKDLSDTVLEGDFAGLSFNGFRLRGARFVGCSLQGCDFTDADISGCRIRLSAEQLRSTKNFRERSLDGIEFVGCNFSGVDFSGQQLGHFRRCNLKGARFNDACLVTAPERVRDEGFGGFAGFSECDLAAEQFASTRTYRSGRLPARTGFTRMDLDGWDLSGMELYHAEFAECSLKGANLNDVRGGLFRYAGDLTLDQARSTWNYKHAKLDEPGFSLPPAIAEVLRMELAARGR